MEKFLKPEFSIEPQVVGENKAAFVIEPLERGFGITLGNAIRRVLLSSLPGAAMCAVAIDGVRHEFQPIKGVREDAVSFILNLKQVNYAIDDFAADMEGEIKLYVTGPKKVTAGDFVCPTGIHVLNEDAYICEVCEGGVLDATIYVKTGRGYILAEQNKNDKQPFGTIPTDSNFTPIRKVGYEVVPTRVGHDNNYDKLTLEVTTTGAITPSEAVSIASKILMDQFELFHNIDENIKAKMQESTLEEKKEEKVEDFQDIAIEDLELSPRSYNCLKHAKINSLTQLIQYSRDDLLKIHNLGKKSETEIVNKVNELGYKFKEK